MKGMPQFDMDNPAKWIDQHGGIENAMLMQGGGGGTAMTFVHLNNQTIKSKEQAEEMVVNWRNLLMTAGIEVGVYVIEPHMLLLDTQDKRKVVEIKDFITKEAPGGEEHGPGRYTYESLAASVAASAARLGVQTVDLLQLHCPPMEVLQSDSETKTCQAGRPARQPFGERGGRVCLCRKRVKSGGLRTPWGKRFPERQRCRC